MAWRVARSVLVLFDQLNTLYPNRSKASDGTIGDENHEPPSDHLPDAGGVVRAGDYTHDPARGADMGRISDELRRSRDRRIKYVIFNERMFSSYPTSAYPAWTWRPYSGSNPHDHHMHLSVVSTTVADDTTPWQIGDDMATAAEVWGYGHAQYLIWRAAAAAEMNDVYPGGPQKGQPVPLVQTIRAQQAALVALTSKVDKLTAMVATMSAGGTSVDTAAVLAAIEQRTAEEVARDADQTAQIVALQAELAAYRKAEADAARAAATALDT